MPPDATVDAIAVTADEIAGLPQALRCAATKKRDLHKTGMRMSNVGLKENPRLCTTAGI